MVVVIDNEDRENEGDLIMAADYVTGEAVNFMITYGKGLVCVPMEKRRALKLGLNQMVVENTDRYGTAFTISVDHKDTTIGISAFERARTIKALTCSQTESKSFRRPGHIFPLIAKEGGVLGKMDILKQLSIGISFRKIGRL